MKAGLPIVLLLAAGCAPEHAAAVAPALPSASVASAPPPAQPLTGPLGIAPSPPPPAPRLDGAVPAATRTFTSVPTPKADAKLVSIDGRGPADIWLLGEGNQVMRWDGKRVGALSKPSCPWKADFKYPGRNDYETSDASFTSIAALPDRIDVLGMRMQSGMRGGYALGVDATSSTGRTWTCNVHSDVFYPTFELAVGGVVFTVMFQGLLADGAPMPKPNLVDTSFWARSRFDAWMADNRSGAVFRWNGARWLPRPTDLARVVDLWEDEHGDVWVIGRDDDKRDSAANAVRRMKRGGAWEPVAIPPDFAASIVRGSSFKDVWFLGGKRWYQWDGEGLRAMDAAMPAVAGAWAGGGELWVVGRGIVRSGAGT